MGNMYDQLEQRIKTLEDVGLELLAKLDKAESKLFEQEVELTELRECAENHADLLVSVAQIFMAQTRFNESVKDALETPFGLPENLAEIVKLRPGELDPRD